MEEPVSKGNILLSFLFNEIKNLDGCILIYEYSPGTKVTFIVQEAHGKLSTTVTKQTVKAHTVL